MKKIISMLSLLIVLMCGFSYAETIDTDKTIRLDRYTTESIDSKDEADYFRFHLPKQGSIQIEFEFDVDGKYVVRVYDLNNGQAEFQYEEFYTDYNTTSGIETFFTEKVRVKAGDYAVKVASKAEAIFGEDYKVKVNYVQESKGNYEVEANNTAKDAIEIDANETMTANLHWDRDEDFYMVDIPYAGRIQLNFEFNYNGAYNVVLYKQAGTKLEEMQFNVASTDTKPYGGEYFSQNFNKLRVSPGTYYIKVNNKTYSNEDYYLTVLYNIERYGSFESEFNDDIKNATEMYNNKEYIGNLNSDKDVDYYFGYINKGELDVCLVSQEDSTYWVEISKENANGTLQNVTRKELKKEDNKFETLNIEESGRYYFRVSTGRYSNQDYTIKFMNNIYAPVYYPMGQTQIDLQIGNQYMNVNGVARLIDNNGTMPVLLNGRTMLPIRAVVEALGGTIAWDANTFTTTVAIGGKNISIRIGDMVAYVNGTAKSLDVPAQLINQRTMLPLRFIMENLGGNVTWEDATQIVRIKY